MTQPDGPHDVADDGGEGRSGLLRITVGLTPVAQSQLAHFMTKWRMTKTDAVNEALRRAAMLDVAAAADADELGVCRIKVVRSDGAIVEMIF